MDDKFHNINKKMNKSIILKALIFIILLFIFSKWNTIEKLLTTILNK